MMEPGMFELTAEDTSQFPKSNGSLMGTNTHKQIAISPLHYQQMDVVTFHQMRIEKFLINVSVSTSFCAVADIKFKLNFPARTHCGQKRIQQKIRRNAPHKRVSDPLDSLQERSLASYPERDEYFGRVERFAVGVASTDSRSRFPAR